MIFGTKVKVLKYVENNFPSEKPRIIARLEGATITLLVNNAWADLSFDQAIYVRRPRETWPAHPLLDGLRYLVRGFRIPQTDRTLCVWD